MKVERRTVGDVVIVDLKGRLVAGEGDLALHKAIDDVLSEGTRKILLNLAEVVAIDSSGVGELVAGRKVAEGFGAKLKLLGPRGRVHHVLDLMLLLPIFESYDDEAAAVASFSV